MVRFYRTIGPSGTFSQILDTSLDYRTQNIGRSKGRGIALLVHLPKGPNSFVLTHKFWHKIFLKHSFTGIWCPPPTRGWCSPPPSPREILNPPLQKPHTFQRMRNGWNEVIAVSGRGGGCHLPLRGPSPPHHGILDPPLQKPHTFQRMCNTDGASEDAQCMNAGQANKRDIYLKFNLRKSSLVTNSKTSRFV